MSEGDLARLLAEQFGLQFLQRIDDASFDENLSSNLLRLDAVQFSAVPYKEEDGKLIIAISDPRRMADVEFGVCSGNRYSCAPPKPRSSSESRSCTPTTRVDSARRS